MRKSSITSQPTSVEKSGTQETRHASNDKRSHVHLEQDNVQADAEVTNDGRLDVSVVGEENELNRLLHPILDNFDTTPTPVLKPGQGVIPLSIVIHVIGSRGDVQPFVALGKELQKFGHRVRIATHPTFKRFVEDNELEFFSIGGNPADLMAYMVKNPGMLPGRQAILEGEIGKKRKAMAEMFEGCWRSCVEAGNGMGAHEPESRPFIANAIIANPPSFTHVHCAEKLKIPLHLMFTMPWSPTQAFPHPLANIRPSNADPKMVNYLSYTLLETLTWQGLGDLINRMREGKLGLSPLTATSAPGTIVRLKIPYSYAWSPALIPKPKDWGSHITIPGFYFLSLASKYTPPTDLEKFLSSGPPPVYIGFGSIVVEDPDAMTALIFAAIQACGVRALVSQGWGGLRGDEASDNIFMLGDCPHDWLFEKVSCVVHHGGAGTTAAGIKAGKPTVVIPFFGDQPFWGDMIARAGAGPQPIPYKQLTADKLASAIKEALQPTTASRAAELGLKIKQENGPANGVTSFHDMLPMDLMRCAVSAEKVAVWRIAKTNIRLSAMVAFLLIEEGLIDAEKSKLYGPCDYMTEHGAFEPVFGVSTAAVGLLGDYLSGFTDVVRGAFSRDDDGPQNRDHEIPTTSGAIGAQGETPNTGENQKSADGVSKTASRSMQGLTKIASATMKAPMDIALSMAQGLHNAPKIYGDLTVREMHKVTGLGSGLKAAGKEVVLGVYDGFSGVVTQPIQGRREGGTAGMYKGIGKGIGGMLLKPVAGLAGLFGLTFKGIYEEIQKIHGKTVESHIRASLIMQGYNEVKDLTADERAAILAQWKKIEANNRKQRKWM